MFDISFLTHVLALLNVATAFLLVVGYTFIRRGDRAAHKKCMISAVSVAVLFIVVYVYYHANAGLAKFGGEGTVRTVYFTLLAAHVSIAFFIPFLAPLVLFRALKGRFEKHKRLARWTLPLWLYVSASGVVVYIMSVHLYPFDG